MKRLRPTVAVAVVALVALGACGGASPSDNASSGSGKKCSSTTTIKFNVGAGTPQVGFAPIFSVPQAAGFWKDACITVESPRSVGTTSLIQQLVNGQINAIHSGPNGPIAANLQGAKLVSVYGSVMKNQFSLATLKGSPITRLSQLSGKTVGLNSLADQDIPLFKAEIKQDGGDPSSVKLIAVGSSAAALSALKSGKVDALGLWTDPFAVFESTQGAQFNFLHSPLEKQVNWSASIWMDRGWVDAHKAAVGGFLRGISEGITFARDNPAEAVRMHWKLYPASKPTGVSESQALTQAVQQLKAKLAITTPVGSGPLGKLPDSTARSFSTFATDNHIFSAPVDIGQQYTNEFVKVANDFDAASVKAAADSSK